MDCSKLSKVFGIERFHCTSKHVVTHTEQYGCIQLQSMCTARHGRLPTTHTTLHQPPSPLVPHTLTSFAYTTCVYILVNMHTYTCTFTCIHACMYALVWGSQYINRHHISSKCAHAYLLVASPQFMQVLCTLLSQLARPP